ncbi:MFS transporter [Pseudotabrizicola alkalilacus]|uniref:MFS transporter n=1 Tax=Pseudotabrizicola alkalilacus TaxID=2305252 RepID=A0A411Z1Z3_9RHOB|nr:MFS transporter [Pseudotabrizicola alkalilacus]RGP37083.1 MFS transporter [Pseudotabrizicola alkalilacus]
MPSPIGFLRQNAPWLFAGFLLTFSSSFGQTFFIAVFAGDIRQEFGLTNAGWGGIYALATMASAACMVFAGGLTDRFRVRLISPVIMIGLAVATALVSLSTSIAALTFAIFLLRLMGQGMMMQTSMVAMSRWFVATRGRAISIAALGVSLGEAMLPLAFVGLMGWFEWRTLWMVAALFLVVAAGVMVLVLKSERTPQAMARDNTSVGMGGRSWTRVEVLRHWLFWLTLPALLGPAAWNTAFFFHQVHFAEAKGWAHFDLVSLFPVFSATAVTSMLLTGWLVDRIGSPRIAGLYLIPMAFGYLLIGMAETLWIGAGTLMLLGASVGASSTMSAALWAEFFGTANLGRIRAMTGAVMVLGSALGPGICGWLIDRGVDMPQQAFGMSAYFVIAATLGAIGGRRAARYL